MRIVLRWLDQLRDLTVESLEGFANAVVAEFQEIAEAANKWAGVDHNPDGTHDVVRFSVTDEPDATAGAISLWWDGTNLKYKKPDGTTGNVV